MRFALLALLLGVVLGTLGPDAPAEAQTCSNVHNHHSSQICNCGGSAYTITSTDIFENHNSQAVLPCIIVVPVTNIQSGSVVYITDQCVSLPGNGGSDNMTVGAKRNDECALGKYLTKVQMPDLTDCNDHPHEFDPGADDTCCCGA